MSIYVLSLVGETVLFVLAVFCFVGLYEFVTDV